MRRAIARGRLVPQSLSTDPRMGRVSLKAALLFPLMWINCDDQGRISGDPDEIKYATCPNIDHITKADIAELLKELETQGFLKVYATSKTKAAQMLDWWEEQHLQWAYPSHYPPAPGWADHLRYHPTPKEIITENWPPSGQQLAFEELPSKLPNESAKELPSKQHPAPEELGGEIRSTLMALPETLDRLAEHELMKDTLAKLGRSKGFSPKKEMGTEEGRIDLWWEEPTGDVVAAFEIDVYEPRRRSLTKLKALHCPYAFIILRTNPEPLRWEQDVLLIGLAKELPTALQSDRESSKEIIEKEKEEEKERGRGKGRLPSALGSNSSPSLTGPLLFQSLTDTHYKAWGKMPDSRETALLRDMAQEISSAGGATPTQVLDAYREAASQNKLHVSYVRAILYDWLGIERERSP